jgi:ribosomal protein S18 acetylase RimI-like enzyme
MLALSAEPGNGLIVASGRRRPDGTSSRLDPEPDAADTSRPMAPRILSAGPERVDELRPLWLQLHHHHEQVSRVQPFVDDETSWTVRRRSYVDTFDGGGFALVAEDDDGLVGYAMVRIHDGPDDSWALADRYGEVWTLVVDERARGRGIGSALLDAVDAELAARGIGDLVIGVMQGNDGARRLYERRGLIPGWLQLYRLAAATR